eukprot:g7126.t2
MQGAGRPTSARLFDRRRRRIYRKRSYHGKSRAGAGTLVSWGFRNMLQLSAGILLFFVGLRILMLQPSGYRGTGPPTEQGESSPKFPEGLPVLPTRPQNPPQHPEETAPPSARRPPGLGERAGAAGAIEVLESRRNTEPPERRPPPAEPRGGGGSPNGVGSGREPGGGGAAPAGAGVGATAYQTPASGKDDGGGGGGDSVGAFEDPADGVYLAYEGGGVGGVVAEAGPIEAFLAKGGKLPVLLLTCNRAELLGHTIESLRKVRGLNMDSIMVLQDGTDQKVAALVRKNGLYLKQNTVTPGLRGGPRAGDDGARRIAMHYKFAMEHAFERRPDAPAVVIVEDDLLFSPDFLEYLETNAPVLERDPTTLVLSAWNDNGYKGRVSDKAELKRTLYFPGLGWLLTRRLFNELGPNWPMEHWDHWLRDEKQHKGRECVYPEVPRTFHNGIKGTFMDKKMHDKLFKNIDYNTDSSFSWKNLPAPSGGERIGSAPPVYLKGLQGNYESRVEARIRGARHINNLDDLPTSSSTREGAGEGEQVVMWYSLQQTEEVPGRRGSKRKPQRPFEPLSSFFGIWHEYRRGEHLGMHSFRYEGNSHVMLINAAKSPYVRLKPPGLLPATTDTLRGGPSGGGGPLKVVAGESASMSCDQICSAQGMRCKESTFALLNSCRILTEHFPCTVCSESYGTEQPCYVEPDAPALNFPGQCLISSNPTTSRCSASHYLTRRLCPCVPA